MKSFSFLGELTQRHHFQKLTQNILLKPVYHHLKMKLNSFSDAAPQERESRQRKREMSLSGIYLALMTANSMRTLSSDLQRAVVGITAGT